MKISRAFYVFYYRTDQVRARRQHRRSGWRRPKEFLGSFLLRSRAQLVRAAELRKYGRDLAPNYAIKHLTPAQFERAWGGSIRGGH